MRSKKRLMLGICGICCLFILASASRGQTVLTSMKKVEGKSWALLTFNDRVQWIGVSQLEKNKLSLYFRGNAGDLNNASVSIGPSSARKIKIQQMSRDPMLCRADIGYDGKIPVAVFKRDRIIVVALNDNTLINKQQLSYPGDDIYTYGRLVNITPVIQDNQVMTTWDFDGEFELSGYLKMSDEIGVLLLQGAQIGDTDTDYSYDMSSLKRIRLFREEGQAPGIKAILSFDSYALFNIIKQPGSLAIQTPLTGEVGGGEVLVAEEASAIPDAVVIQEAAMVDSAVPSLDQMMKKE